MFISIRWHLDLTGLQNYVFLDRVRRHEVMGLKQATRRIAANSRTPYTIVVALKFKMGYVPREARRQWPRYFSGS